MYASTWICTKTEDVVQDAGGRMSAFALPESAATKRSASVEDLQI